MVQKNAHCGGSPKLGESFKNSQEHALLDPLLEMPMAGLIRWVALGQIRPRRPSVQALKDAVEHVPRISPGSSTTLGPSRWLGGKRLQEVLLLVGKILVPPPARKRRTAAPQYRLMI